VTGYYPFFSAKTKDDFILKGLVRRFFKIIPGTPKMNSRQVLERLTANYWYEVSNKTLAQAVAKVNAERGDQAGRVWQFDYRDEAASLPQLRRHGIERVLFVKKLVKRLTVRHE
jgi:hypothetical protein